MSGWIKLHRNIRKHWIWNDPVKFKWWVDILLTVNHEDNKVNMGLKLIECKRGQSVMSLSGWAKQWGVSKHAVNNFFTLLKNDNMITAENLIKTIRITVCNYDSYQDNLNASGTDGERTGNASGTDGETNKNIKKEKKEKNEKEKNNNGDNDVFSFEKVWEAYGRKGNKKSARQRWENLMQSKKRLALEHIPLYVLSTPEFKYRKDFSTYISKEAWNDEVVIPNDTRNAGSSKLGVGEWMKDGKRYYGSPADPIEVPLDMEPRPSERYWFNPSLKQWNL